MERRNRSHRLREALPRLFLTSFNCSMHCEYNHLKEMLAFYNRNKI
ncbi:unnamed protein product [Musa banksii]